MSKKNGNTKSPKVTKSPRVALARWKPVPFTESSKVTKTLGSMDVHDVLADIQPKVSGLWGLSVEHHQRLERLEQIIGDQVIRETEQLTCETERLVQDGKALTHQLDVVQRINPSDRKPTHLRLLPGGKVGDASGSHGPAGDSPSARSHLRLLKGDHV